MAKKGFVAAKVQSTLLASILEQMLRAGFSSAWIKKAVSSELARHRLRSQQSKRNAQLEERALDDVAAQVLRVWHRDDRYLSRKDAKPRPLPFEGGRASLRSLITQLGSQVSARAVLSGMITVGLVRQTPSGRYLPTANATVIPCLHPWALEHTDRSMKRLASTIARNASRSPKLEPLLERYSYVPDLDPDQAIAFARFSRAQGQAFLDSLDDWLEQRRANGSKTSRVPGIAAGVHVIAYLDERSESAPVRTVGRGRQKDPARNATQIGRRRGGQPATSPP